MYLRSLAESAIIMVSGCFSRNHNEGNIEVRSHIQSKLHLPVDSMHQFQLYCCASRIDRILILTPTCSDFSLRSTLKIILGRFDMSSASGTIPPESKPTIEEDGVHMRWMRLAMEMVSPLSSRLY